MYELTVAGFGEEQHVAIMISDWDEDVTIVHHFPVGASARDALKLLAAFNAAHDRAFEAGMGYCASAHEKPRTAWVAGDVDGPATLKSDRPRFCRMPEGV